MFFEIVSKIVDVKTIARGPSIRERRRLQARYGRGRWRKLKGEAIVQLPGGRIYRAELHWYESDGIGRREMKIKRVLSER